MHFRGHTLHCIALCSINLADPLIESDLQNKVHSKRLIREDIPQKRRNNTLTARINTPRAMLMFGLSELMEDVSVMGWDIGKKNRCKSCNCSLNSLEFTEDIGAMRQAYKYNRPLQIGEKVEKTIGDVFIITIFSFSSNYFLSA